jgi:hypothetical protein
VNSLSSVVSFFVLPFRAMARGKSVSSAEQLQIEEMILKGMSNANIASALNRGIDVPRRARKKLASLSDGVVAATQSSSEAGAAEPDTEAIDPESASKPRLTDRPLNDETKASILRLRSANLTTSDIAKQIRRQRKVVSNFFAV